MPASAKICGLTTPEAVEAALVGGASYFGFVFFAKSPRMLTPDAAAALAGPIRAHGRIVAVTVDPTDAELDGIASALRPDLIQLHGRETPERARDIAARTGAGIVRSFSISGPGDLDASAEWDGVADHLMFDAKTPPGSALPGGMGARFDWAMLAGKSFSRPWFLAGGLTPINVEQAVAASGAPLVDVSSGVESSPGLKDPALVAAFLEAVRRIR